jgi:hypothetical protein
MPIVSMEKLICGVCGEESRHQKRGGLGWVLSIGLCYFYDVGPATSYFCEHEGIPRCPVCGYSAFTENFSSCSEEVKKLVVSKGYQAIIGSKELPKITASFLALSYEKQYVHQYSDAAWYLIYAAWSCDSKGSYGASKKCREKAICMIEKANAHGQKITDDEGTSEVITIHLMRRAGLFEQALQLAEETKTHTLGLTIKQEIWIEEELIALKNTDPQERPELISVVMLDRQDQEIRIREGKLRGKSIMALYLDGEL